MDVSESAGRTIASAVMTLVVVGCTAASSPTTTPTAPSSAPASTIAPTASPSPVFDADLIASHEAACQEYFAVQGWTGLQRVLVAQPSGHPVHVYVDGSESVYCVPMGSGIHASRRELVAGGYISPYLVSTDRGFELYTSSAGSDLGMHFISGQVDPVVGGIAAEAMRYAADGSDGEVWTIAGVIQNGWYLLGTVDESARGNWIARAWSLFDLCGHLISSASFEDSWIVDIDETPCSPSP